MAAMASDQIEDKQVAVSQSIQNPLSEIKYRDFGLLPEDVFVKYIIPDKGMIMTQLNRTFFERVTGYKAEDISKEGFNHFPIGPRISLNTKISLKNSG